MLRLGSRLSTGGRCGFGKGEQPAAVGARVADAGGEGMAKRVRAGDFEHSLVGDARAIVMVPS